MALDKPYLEHILEAINAIEMYTADVSFEKFMVKDIAGKMLRDAVVRELEIIGEAVKHLNSESKNLEHEVGWKEIAGMRDNLIHEYFGVNFEVVWETIKEDFPVLKKSVTKLLSAI